ncbi:hypothetical protein BH18ACT9_BH18ACT9_10910 [soil metagenome]
MTEPGAPIQAVIFDWGGTLTPWHTVDFEEESLALAAAALDTERTSAAEALRAAGEAIWARSRDHHVSATVADIFSEAGLSHDEQMLTAYRSFWEPHTLIDPDVLPLFTRLKVDGLKVGVLSNTVWPRQWHEEYFGRDGVLEMLDGAIYTSEVPWTKPAPEVFHAASKAVGADSPESCVFVGDRRFDDIWGAGRVGMRTILVPHSDIPLSQVGHSEGEPDAVVERLAHVYDVVATWRARQSA